jgi:hypothetical protein
MANTIFQLRRNSVSGTRPTTSSVSPGELAINTTDGILFSANATSVFEIGSNLTSLAVGNSTVRQTANSSGVYVNGSISGANVTTTTNVATIGTAAYFVANGNVGIGTSSPSSKLTVSSTATGTYEIGRFLGVANSSPYLYHMTIGGSPNFTLLSYGPQPSAVYPTLVIRGFYSNAAGGDAGGYPQIEFVRSGGNTSITTATPSGSVLSRIISYGSNSTSSLPGTIIESVAEADFTTTSTTGIRFQTANTGSLAERMRIAANGNVGIGTSTPGAMLAVTGTANISGNVVFGSGISVNGSFGTAGQLLTSNGTGTYWSTATSGGGGGSANFNTNNNTAIGFAANTTLQAAYTAPATAGIRYIIYSVHVTNIGSANATISCNFNGSTYANISFAQSVPVPVGSSVEMLKKPKIMQPSDALRIQASLDSTLHATISYETQTSTTLFGAGVDISSVATYADLYTATGICVVESVLLMNDDGVYDCKARVVWTDGSNNIQGYYCYDLIVPAGATIEVLESSKALPSGYKVRVYCNAADRLEATIAGKVSG